MCRKAHIIRAANIIRRSRHHLPQANIIQKKNLCLGRQRFFFCWCEKRDLNPYGEIHTPLKRARLPVPPLSHIAFATYILYHKQMRLSIGFWKIFYLLRIYQNLTQHLKPDCAVCLFFRQTAPIYRIFIILTATQLTSSFEFFFVRSTTLLQSSSAVSSSDVLFIIFIS